MRWAVVTLAAFAAWQARHVHLCLQDAACGLQVLAVPEARLARFVSVKAASAEQSRINFDDSGLAHFVSKQVVHASTPRMV